MSGDSPQYTVPTYSIDEQGADILRIVIKIPGLQAVKYLKMFKCAPTISKEIENGRAQIEFNDTGFSFWFLGSKSLKDKNYCLIVKDLPFNIVPLQSKYRPHTDEMHILMKKSNCGSWLDKLVEGLRTVPPEEAELPRFD